MCLYLRANDERDRPAGPPGIAQRKILYEAVRKHRPLRARTLSDAPRPREPILVAQQSPQYAEEALRRGRAQGFGAAVGWVAAID